MAEHQQGNGRFAVALFCDDIRLEIGGKLTLVGVYNADMYLSELPAFIPKLSIWLQVSTPVEQPFKTLTIRVARGDELMLEFSPTLVFAQARRTADQDQVSRASSHANIGLPPLTIPSPCTLRVVAIVDDVEFAAGKLHIGLKPPAADGVPAADSAPDRPLPEATPSGGS